MAKGRNAPDSQRQLRVGELVRHALAEVLTRGELRDPALVDAHVTVSEVRMSPDLRHAVCFVMPLGGGEAKPVLEGLARFLFTEEGDIDREAFGLDRLEPCRNWPPEAKPGLRLGNGDGHRGTWGPAPVFKTSALREIGGFPTHFGNGAPVPTIIDFIVWDRLLKEHKKVSRGSIVVGSYYSNPASQQEFRGGEGGVAGEHRLYEQYGAMV